MAEANNQGGYVDATRRSPSTRRARSPGLPDSGRFTGGRGSITLPPLASTVFPAQAQFLPPSHTPPSPLAMQVSPRHPPHWPQVTSASSASAARYPGWLQSQDQSYNQSSIQFSSNTLYDTTRYQQSQSSLYPNLPPPQSQPIPPQPFPPPPSQQTDPSRRLPPLDYLTGPLRDNNAQVTTYGYNSQPPLEASTRHAGATYSTQTQHSFTENAPEPEWEWGLHSTHSRAVSFEQQSLGQSSLLGHSSSLGQTSTGLGPSSNLAQSPSILSQHPLGQSAELAAMSNIGSSSSLKMRSSRVTRPASPRPQRLHRPGETSTISSHRRSASGPGYAELMSSRSNPLGLSPPALVPARIAQESSHTSATSNTAGILFRARSYPTRVPDPSPPELDSSTSTRPQEVNPRPQELNLDANLEPDPTIVKKKRKRADANQLRILNETYARTAFPSTEERADLARRLEMSARSVQIWFQNKRQSSRQNRASSAADSPTRSTFPSSTAPASSTPHSISGSSQPINIGLSATISGPITIPLPDPPGSATSSHFGSIGSGSAPEYSSYSPEFGPRTTGQDYGHRPPASPEFVHRSAAQDFASRSTDYLTSRSHSLDYLGSMSVRLPGAGSAQHSVGSAPVRSHMSSQYPAQGSESRNSQGRDFAGGGYHGRGREASLPPGSGGISRIRRRSSPSGDITPPPSPRKRRDRGTGR